MNIRIRPQIHRASGGRKGWMKVVTKVDPNGRNGYSFDGEFLTDGVEVDLPVGSVIIRVDPEGSVKNGYQLGNVLKLQADGTMESLEYGDWKSDFLTLRDAAAKALTPAYHGTYCSDEHIDAAVKEIYEMQGMRESDPEGVMGCRIAQIIAKHLSA